MVTQRILIPDNEQAALLFGRQESNLKVIERELGVSIASRGNEVTVRGDPQAAERTGALLGELVSLLERGYPLDEQDVQYAAQLAREGRGGRIEELFSDVILVTARSRPIRPKTYGQKLYVDAVRRHDIVFGIGPAGTGKSYLAMALAVAALRAREYARIILTRPAVEAGEKLGFLPGDLQEKVHPYLRPLYDALYDIMGVEGFERAMAKGVIEVAPLAYMRGRTLDDSFVILDEAQNTTREQMKMFLTRLGFGSKAVVTGDVTQVDLPRDRYSGLEEVRHVLRGVDGIAFVYLTERDVVRHPLVQKIIRAYEAYEAETASEEERGGTAGPRRAAEG
ncbi:MAG: PhoH family protein [Clostridia bacterium]|nr:PhoH family protein [Clostridia bacterium]